MLILVLVCLPIFLVFAAFSISIAYMQLTRTELRIATDAATRAGSRTLSLRQSQSIANARAHEAAGKNLVAGDPLLLEDSDIQWGFAEPRDQGRWAFSVDPLRVNSIRVTGRRTTDAPSGNVPLPFTPFLGAAMFEPVKSSTATQIDRDISLVLDRSGSMSWPTVGYSGPPRWNDLLAAVDAFLIALENTPMDEQVALVSYETMSTIDHELTLQYSDIRARVGTLRPAGATGIGFGLRNGLTAVTNPSHRRVFAARTIVVMTDGHHNSGVNPTNIAALCAQQNVTVHTVTFSAGANQAHMKEVARVGGGKHWHAATRNSLINAFREIANNLPTLMTE